MVGLHYNRKVPRVILWSLTDFHFQARNWEDPYSFKPERFLKDWPRDIFVPFSAGKYLLNLNIINECSNDGCNKKLLVHVLVESTPYRAQVVFLS